MPRRDNDSTAHAEREFLNLQNIDWSKTHRIQLCFDTPIIVIWIPEHGSTYRVEILAVIR